MKNMTITKVAEAVGGEIILPHDMENPPASMATGVVIDNRLLEKGNIFVAIKGERVDGHKFIPGAIKDGAIFAVSEQRLAEDVGPYILVESTTDALKKMGAYYRRQLGIPIVGIIGSVGKTSTKEMVASVLSGHYCVLKTEGNFNNEIGLPLTLFKIDVKHEAAVVEMGISDFGEMHRLGEIAQPNIVVMTNIGQCHLEQLHDRDGILKAKTEVFEHLGQNPVVVLNGDDDKLATVTPEYAHGAKVIFYGRENGEYRAADVKNLGLEGVGASITTPKGGFSVVIPLPGEHNVYNALAAAAVGCELGLSCEEIRRGIESVQTIKGRSRFIKLRDGITLIDDCYNANPVSMRASLKVLEQAEGRKIAVLGDMGELGEDEVSMHYELGRDLAGMNIDELFTAGTLSRNIADGAQSVEDGGVNVHAFDTRDAMVVALVRSIEPGDTVLLKASHFMDFSMAVDTICSNVGGGEAK